MTLKEEKIFLEELELIKGERIDLLESDAIPCVEISDPLIFKHIPLVSVVVITYNHERFIRKAIEGIVNQNSSFLIELIISDDCSADKTLDIIKEYQKKYPQLIRILYANLNIGIVANALRSDIRTRGKYIAYCEGDDYWIDVGKLQKQVSIMESDPEIGLIFTGAKEYLLETNRFISVKTKLLSSEIHPKNYFFKKKLNTDIFIPTCTVMVRQSNIISAIKNNIVFKINSKMMDSPRWFAASFNMKTYFLNDITGVYVIHSDSVSNNWDMKKESRQGCLILYGFTYAIPTNTINMLVGSKVFHRIISNAFYHNDKELATVCKNLAKKRNVRLTIISKLKLYAMNLPILRIFLNYILENSRKIRRVISDLTFN